MNRPNYYKYPAVFSPDGDGWTVRFPDLDNCFTSADTVEEAIVEAQAVLQDCMYFREEQKDEIPRPTSMEDVALEEGSFVQAVVAVMPPVRRAWSRKAVKKTLTIPAWMEEAAPEAGGCHCFPLPAGGTEKGTEDQGTGVVLSTTPEPDSRFGRCHSVVLVLRLPGVGAVTPPACP